MNTGRSSSLKRVLTIASAVLALGWTASAQAHCDTLDGPVVGAARKALDTNDVDLVLIWVQEKDEAAIKDQFQKTVAVRKASKQAKELADMYFFETLVRIHRAGEGAGYTGIKPAGKIEPPIAAADRSIEAGKLQEVAQLLSKRTEQGLHRSFEAVMVKKKYDSNDVTAGRAFVGAYVDYTHHVERLYNAAATAVPAQAEKAAPGVHAH